MNGSTQVLGVVGDPIAQVRSPEVWTALFQHNGVNAACVPLHIRPADLPSFFAGIRTANNLKGLIATIPHKQSITTLVDELTPRAEQVGAANVVMFDAKRRTRGDILDGAGLVDSLRARSQEVEGRRALIVGSGGVGSAIAFAVADAGAREVCVSDIIAERAAQLADRLRATGFSAQAHAPDPLGFDLVINATPLGMRQDDPLPFNISRLDSSAIVADVVIHAALTPVLTAARAQGCFVHPGVHMSDAQVAVMAEFFGFGPGDWSAQTIARLLAPPRAPSRSRRPR